MVVDPKVQTTWQPYAYASDDPLSFTDPSGLDFTQAQQRAGIGSSCGERGKPKCSRSAIIGAIANAIEKHPGEAVEVAGLIAVQFIPGADAAADAAAATDAAASGDAAGGAASATVKTGAVYLAGQTTNYVTGHFTVGGAVMDATFSSAGAFPDLAESAEAKEILERFATATGATGIPIGVLAENRLGQ